LISMTFDEAITSGGDERIELKANGLNKYYLNPLVSNGHLNRGSCTCSPISDDVKPRVKGVFNRITSKEATVEDIRIKQRFRMKALLQDSYTQDFNIFFAPSGSDLCYFPLLFSKITDPSRPIMSLITCPEELGTGTLLANGGKYFSEKTQVLESVEKGSALNNNLEVSQILFAARDIDGNILDHKAEIYNAIEQYKDSHHIIVNLVIGSKSGIEDNISIIKDGPQNVTYVVDLCQMRATPKLFNELLELNCLLMITGSKFYQSPPFCGALLIPEKVSSSIKKAEITPEMVAGFDTVFSKYDIPPVYKNIRAQFHEIENIGLTLRWEAALCESELIVAYGERDVTYAISAWNKKITEALSTSDKFILMFDQDKTNRSIVSFMVQKDDKILNSNQLKMIYDELLLNSKKYQSKYESISIGQPVNYENHSFLRFALGSRNIRNLIESGYDYSSDELIVTVLEKIIEELNF
jgi:hypothetical protein